MNNPISSAHLERWIDGSLSSSSSPAQQRIDSDAPNPNPGLPPWVLLDQVAYIDYDGRENATTAKAGTIFGTVKVTFFAAEPPHLSHFSVHCSGLTKLDFMGKPRIHMSVDNMALISVSFACGFTTEYFFYRCGHGRRPTLEHLKPIGDYLKKVPLVASIGFLPRGHGGEDFLLAALAFTNSADNYQLHVFRPEDHVWTNKAICLGKHYSIRNIEKVMTIENNVAFVDLWKGILICNVLVENPTVRFILFPPLLAGNQEKDQMSSGRLIRDVMYSNGLLRCVEIEHVIKETSQKNTKTEPQDLLKLEVFYDRDLMQDKKVTKEENFLLYDGWRVLTRSRTLSSSVCWFRDEGFSVNDINSAPYTRLLSDLGGSGCTLKDLFIAAPTLTMGWTDYLYILSMVRTRSQNCCVIVVDLVQRKLEGLIPIPTQKANFFCPTYVPSSLTKYLSMDSDETCIDEQNELDSSDYQEYEETVDVSAEAIRNNYPPAQLYSDYSTLTTSSDIFPHSHQRQQSPVEVPHSSWQRSLSSSGESQIGSGNRSWSTSSPQPINESGGSCATSSARYPWSAQYRDSSPITPTSLAPCYHQHQELGHLSGSLPRSSPQMTEESIRSCITTSGHNSGVQFSLDSSPVTPSGAFTFYANHHHHQQPPREAACPLWQSSQPSRSYSSTHQMTEESIRSCITSTSGHSSGVQFSLDSSPVTPSGAFCANHNHHHHHQPPREVACPLWQSSQPSRSSSSTHQEKLGQNYDGYYHSPIIPSESRYCQQPSPLSWYSSPSLQKQQLQSGACLFQSASHLSSSRFAAWKPSRHL